MNKKTRIFIIIGMVALLVATGFVNFYLFRGKSTIENTNASNNFFESFRLDREATFDFEIAKLDEIINNANNKESDIKEATSKKMKLIERLEKEKKVEGLIKGLGYEDATLACTDTQFNIFVKTASLTEEQANKITGVVATNYKDSEIANKEFVVTPIEN